MKEKTSDKILAHGGLMFIASNAANVCNYFFHFAMGRMLGPSSYSELTSLISLFYIFGVPSLAIQTVITKYAATFKAKGEYGKVSFLLFRSLRKLSVYAGIGFLGFAAGSGLLASFLKISSVVPVIILGAVVVIGIIIPVGRGALQGFQNFGLLGINMTVDAFLRLLLAVILVYLGLGVSGAIGAQVISGIVALAILVIPLRFLYGEKQDPDINAKEIYKYLWPVIISLLCFNMLTQMDIVLVKHFFHPVEAGYYSGAAMMGRIVLFLPLAMATVMFPKVTEASTLNRDPRSILVKSLLAVAVLCGLVTVAFFVAPALVISASYGAKFVSSAPLVGPFGVAMTFFALLNLLIYYHLSIHRFEFLYALVGMTVMQLAALWFFHSSLAQVITIMAGNGLILCVICWLLAYRRSGVSTNPQIV
jgi:O-antigen/teichoic acid export membrane protein